MELNSLVEESEKNNYITFRLHKKVAGLLLFILLMIALFIGYRAGTQYNNGDDGVVVISPIPTYSEKYIPRTPQKYHLKILTSRMIYQLPLMQSITKLKQYIRTHSEQA